MEEPKNLPPLQNWELISDVNYIYGYDDCYYWGDYLPEHIHKAMRSELSEWLTQQIYNFKKDPAFKDMPAWYYRNNAVTFFAKILSRSIKNNPTTAIMSIPSSKTTDEPDYDNRFEDVFSEFSKVRPLVKVISPIAIDETTISSHAGGTRDPKEIRDNYQLIKPHELSQIDKLIICDDVITTGAHFRAVSDFLTGIVGFEKPITGLFFCKTKKGLPPRIPYSGTLDEEY